MGTDYSAHIVDTETWSERTRILLDYQEVLGLAFGNAHAIVATLTRGKILRVFDLDGSLLAAMETPSTMWTCEFNADDSLLAGGNWGWTIELFDWRREVCIGTLEGHTSTVWAISFHPRDPRIIASSASDGTVRLFDVLSQRCLLTLGNFANSEVLAVGFSADGTRLCAANSTGRAIVWDIDYFDRHIAAQRDYQARNVDQQPANIRAKPPHALVRSQEWRSTDLNAGERSTSTSVTPERIAVWGETLNPKNSLQPLN